MSVEPLETDYTLAETAAALRCSTRWLRDRIKSDKLPHGKRGHKIVFTAGQIDEIRERYNEQPVDQSITTGKRKRS